MTEHRAVFIIEGISREAFIEAGVRATTDDPELEYCVHMHKYNPYGDVPCNDGCTLIAQGVVMTNTVSVTRSDVANPHRTQVS
jgi:hypothetical protein